MYYEETRDRGFLYWYCSAFLNLREDVWSMICGVFTLGTGIGNLSGVIVLIYSYLNGFLSCCISTSGLILGESAVDNDDLSGEWAADYYLKVD